MFLNMKLKWFFRLLGIVVFIFLLTTRVNLTTTLKILPKVALKYLFAAISLQLFLLFLKAWRWWFLLRIQGICYSLGRSVLIYMAGLFVGVMTPGRVGDFVKVIYLRNEGYSLGKSSFSVLWDRFIDVAFLVCFAYISLVFFSHFFATHLLVLSLAILFGLSLTYLLIRKRRAVMGFIERAVSKLMPLKTRAGLEENILDFCRDFKLINRISYTVLITTTLLGWFIYFMMAYFLSQSLSLGISFLVTSACVSISAIVTLVPISIAGIGTRDATLLILFSILGLKSESAIAFSILLLSIYILTGFLGLIAWLLCPLRIVKRSKILKVIDDH